MGDLNKEQRVSMRRIIGNVIDKLQLTDVSSRVSAMASWVVDAELKIGSRNSYEKFECELEVKNYRACLPDNFVRMHAVKSGQDHLDYTMKDFRHFHKGSSGTQLDDPESFVAGNKVRQAQPGVPNVHQIDFTPVFSTGDVITVTVSNDNCGDVTSNTFTYIVLPADTIPLIIAAFVSQINAIGGLPYTAVPDSSFFQILASTPLVNMNVTTYTNSLTGGVSNQLIQARILPVEASTVNGENCDVTVKNTSDNLASRTAYNLNDNIYSEAPYTSGGGLSGLDGDLTATVSKYAIENGYIHFNAMADGKVGVSYDGISLDEEGWPLIAASHEDAITQYLMWQAQIGDWSRGKVPNYIYKELENRWYWLCGQARGDDELPDQAEVQYMANMWNQFIPLPNKNYF